jgi:hypothetical protein
MLMLLLLLLLLPVRRPVFAAAGPAAHLCF